MAPSVFPSQKRKNFSVRSHFWKFRCRKIAPRCGADVILTSRVTNYLMLSTFQRSKCVSRDTHKEFCTFEKLVETRHFVHFSKTSAGVGHLKHVSKRCIFVAGSVFGTFGRCMLRGPSADFLREVAFWKFRCLRFWKSFCVTGAALRVIRPQFSRQAQYFQHLTANKAKRHVEEPQGAQPTCQKWRMSRRFASFSLSVISTFIF